MKLSKNAIIANVAIANGLSASELEAILKQVSETEQTEKEKAKEVSESKKAEKEKAKEAKKKRQTLVASLNDEKAKVKAGAKTEHQSLSTVLNSIKTQCKTIETANIAYNKKIKKAENLRPEKLVLSEVFEMQKFSLSLINANFSASEMKSIVSNRGKYTVEIVVNSLYRIAAKLKFAQLNHEIEPFKNEYSNGKVFVSIIAPYAQKWNELNDLKKIDAKQVRAIKSQLELKQIGENEASERLVKYMTSERMNLEMLTLLGQSLHKVFEAIKPNLSASQFDNYATFYPNLDFLQTLVNQKDKTKIENEALKMREFQPEFNTEDSPL
jgi:hypothetical protein